MEFINLEIKDFKLMEDPSVKKHVFSHWKERIQEDQLFEDAEEEEWNVDFDNAL